MPVTQLISFDGTESVIGDCISPSHQRQLYALLGDGKPSIPRGAGLSYCAASAGNGVRSVSSLCLKRILAFDEATGLIDVEPGIRLGDLYRFTTPRGWILPVMPGHPSITIGGCLGCNVHGKNQCREGNFINVVEGLALFHPDHGEIQCSPDQESTVFRLTVGGFGLTGFVTSVRLRLQRLEGAAVRIRRVSVANLSETVTVMESQGHGADTLYSWNNFNLRGQDFGRGFVYMGHYEPVNFPDHSVFRDLNSETRGRYGPFNAYTEMTVRLLLEGYSWCQRISADDKLIGLAQATFPPNGKEYYFELFGQKGFREYQMLIPHARWDEFCELLPRTIQKRRVPITLGSVKLFHGQSDYLHFDGTGIALSIDVPNGAEAHNLFADLDILTRASGGLVNLSKDGRISGTFARQIFPGYDRFKRELEAFDPHKRFDSSLRKRLNV